MFAQHLGVVHLTDHSGSCSGNLVRRDADTLAAPAHQDSPLDITIDDQLRHGGSEVRVIDPVIRVGSHVGDLVAAIPQEIRDRGLQRIAGVVGPDRHRVNRISLHRRYPFRESSSLTVGDRAERTPPNVVGGQREVPGRN